MLSASPHDPDGTWPCAAIREVIEDLKSPELERGFRVGVRNGRGEVMKAPSAGGAAERTLAERYDGFAVAVRASCSPDGEDAAPVSGLVSSRGLAGGLPFGNDGGVVSETAQLLWRPHLQRWLMTLTAMLRARGWTAAVVGTRSSDADNSMLRIPVHSDH